MPQYKNSFCAGMKSEQDWCVQTIEEWDMSSFVWHLQTYTDKKITKIGVLARSSSKIWDKTQDLLIVLHEKGWAVGLQRQNRESIKILVMKYLIFLSSSSIRLGHFIRIRIQEWREKNTHVLQRSLESWKLLLELERSFLIQKFVKFEFCSTFC
jgi:hypothetical protein